MSNPLPRIIEEYVSVICVTSRFPAYIELTPQGAIAGSGGHCERYGLAGLTVGIPAADAVNMLAGLLPMQREHECIALCQMTPSRYVDVHLIHEATGDWVLFLDASEDARHQVAVQQQSHEITLLHERESRLLKELQAQHSHLLTVFDQLRLATTIIDAEGRISFLSRSGCSFFGISADAARGNRWQDVLRFSGEDNVALEGLLATPESQREKLRTSIKADVGRPAWCELDVRDDPRNPQCRIVHIYDVSEIHDLRDLLKDKASFHGMIGKSGVMTEMFQLIEDVAAVDSTVLIEGETGTGKELVARAIHDSSRRKDGPFITVNCAGLADSLINSQLFGHRKGAFTDAIQDQEGLFEAANGGTIFLDEIGDIPMNTQTRILRALEQREVIRIGETQARKVDIRIVAATNKELVKEVKMGNFRMDLLYRIRVARVLLPPLRKRREDIPLLIESFFRELKAITGRERLEIYHDTLRLLMDYAWPGNVRELHNVIEFASIRAKDGVVKTGDLPPELITLKGGSSAARAAAVDDERERILTALQATKGRRGAAAKLLGVSRATFYRRLKACLLVPQEL